MHLCLFLNNSRSWINGSALYKSRKEVHNVNCMEYITTTNLYGTPFIIFKKLKKIGTMIDDFDEFNDSDSFDESNETTLMALINFIQEVLRYLIR